MASELLFQARFEPPAYDKGLLVPQQGWFADFGEDACFVAPSSPFHRCAKIEGSLLGKTHTGSYGYEVAYDPMKGGGKQEVRMSGYLKYSAPHAVCVAFGLCAPLTGANPGQGEPIVPNALIGIWQENSRLVSFLSNWDGESVNGPAYTINEWIHLEVVFDFANLTIYGYCNNEFFGKIPFTKNIVPIISFATMALVSNKDSQDGIAYFDNLEVMADNKIPSGCLGVLNCLKSPKTTDGKGSASLRLEGFPLP